MFVNLTAGERSGQSGQSTGDCERAVLVRKCSKKQKEVMRRCTLGILKEREQVGKCEEKADTAQQGTKKRP